MKKSISLKEFSTTPSVSYMLSKDGHNIAANHAPPRPTNPAMQPPKEKPKAQPTDEENDAMFEME
ncbi:hypothetical protein STCU_02210 [Strigomonas culicis]|uniref:Uncharacterized protein n=1 Tax=Strigomonas culicis TaxID=28005 RepID=S9UTM8_9TRYP|nr:hypothetical protein STCU_02911 [Strigomonas culicis]EPY33454.1 hypothetical protein STCU_02210 [Strigomonas culicis]|eukprot:EPY32238.1 hypothetical protein STCU_02911 [Strigomonas culicis]